MGKKSKDKAAKKEDKPKKEVAVKASATLQAAREIFTQRQHSNTRPMLWFMYRGVYVRYRTILLGHPSEYHVGANRRPAQILYPSPHVIYGHQ